MEYLVSNEQPRLWLEIINNNIKEEMDYRVGSRKSQLALIQTELVISSFTKIHPQCSMSIEPYSTTGDKILNEALSKIGEKSLFTKELEVALLKNDVDFVVHSLKDMQTTLGENLVIAAILPREDPRDVLILHQSHANLQISTLPANSVIGSSSLRRIAQLKRKFPHLKFHDIRGNLNTRLKKLDIDNCYDGIILAAAGVKRMGWEERISQYLEPEDCLYAVGQGAIAVECRRNDIPLIKMLNQLSDSETALRCIAERTLLKSIEGGCSVPLGVHSTIDGNILTLNAGLFDVDGQTAIHASHSVDLTASNNNFGSQCCEKFTSILMLNIDHDAMVAAYDAGIIVGERLLSNKGRELLDRIKEKV